jgi:hypothetical protein
MVMRTWRFEIVEEGPQITNGSMRGLAAAKAACDVSFACQSACSSPRLVTSHAGYSGVAAERVVIDTNFNEH